MEWWLHKMVWLTENAETYTPAWVPQTVDLSTYRDSIELVLQVANFDHRLGGIREAFLIGNKENVFNEYNLVFGLDLLLAGCLDHVWFIFSGALFFRKPKNVCVVFFTCSALRLAIEYWRLMITPCIF